MANLMRTSAVFLLVLLLGLAAVAQCFRVHPSRPLRHIDGRVHGHGFVDLDHHVHRRSARKPEGFRRFHVRGFEHHLHRRSARNPDQLVSEVVRRFHGLRNGDWKKKNNDDQIPKAKAWAEEFTIEFTTKSGAATGFLAYDWSRQRQMIYHGPNSTYCSQFGTEEACQMYEDPRGTYAYIPSLQKCVLTNEGVGSVPPEWTTNSEYVGTEEVPGVGLCRSYAFPPTSHFWYETVAGSLPCMFVFPDPSMTYHFDPHTFQVGTPDEKYFDLPDYCFEDVDAKIKMKTSEE